MERDRTLSQSHEPSYYEIALTNRQVLVVFVVLLVCVVAAFFSGVWVGRQGDRVQIAEVVEAADNPGDSSPDSGSIEELHFFSGDKSDDKPSLAEVVESPKSDTTLAQDVGVVEAAESDESARPPVENSSTDSSAESVPELQVEEAAQTGQSKAPADKSSKSAEPVALEGEHVIQVFSSADEGQARKLISELAGGGFPAFLSPVEVGGQTMYRVRIGPYTELTEAETVAARVRRSFKLDTWVTR
jgi:cell division septation protein DedD